MSDAPLTDAQTSLHRTLCLSFQRHPTGRHRPCPCDEVELRPLYPLQPHPFPRQSLLSPDPHQSAIPKPLDQPLSLNHTHAKCLFCNDRASVGRIPMYSVAKYWVPSITGGHCIDPAYWIVSCISFVLATDTLILIMPTWMLYDVKGPFSRKFQVISFLLCGLIVTAVGAYRTYTLIKAFVIDRVGANAVGTPPPDLGPTYSVGYCTREYRVRLGYCRSLWTNDQISPGIYHTIAPHSGSALSSGLCQC